MNHICRSFWNGNLVTCAAGDDSAVGTVGKVSCGRSGVARFAVTAMAVALCLGWGGLTQAEPTGGVVTAGTASISSAAGQTTIVQGSQNAAIHWQSFHIGAHEAVRFVQPNAHAVALNRVVGRDPANVLGRLLSNGKVFLVNPDGLLFGQGASVNVGGLVAATLDLPNRDAMAQRYRLETHSPARATHRGQTDASGASLALLGANVGSDGVIAARLGNVALAAGQAVTLDVAGDGLLHLNVDPGAMKSLADRGGLVQAGGGQVLLTSQAARSLLHTLVNNTGMVEAQIIENRGGTIRLLGSMPSDAVNVGHVLDASPPNGGSGSFLETSAPR